MVKQQPITYLEQYYQAIQEGKIIVGYELLDLLESLIEDLHNPEYIYDTKDAYLRIELIEKFCKHTQDPFTGQPFLLMLWQKAFIEVVYSFKIRKTGNDRFKKVLLLIARKNGKALDIKTPIPTPNGIKTMEELQVGDYVYGEDGKPTKIIATSPIFKDHKCYELTFEDGEKIIADEDHLWSVQTKGTRKVLNYQCSSSRRQIAKEKIDKYGYVTLTTKDMVKDFKRVRADKKGIEYKYRVPMNKPLTYEEKNLLISPYVMGVWLGDGTSDTTDITCGQDDLEEMITLLKNEKVEIGNIKPRDNHYLIKLGVKDKNQKNQVREALRYYGVFKNKHIPEEYLTASIEQRKELLKGLMDTDGYCSKTGQCEFVQKNYEIIKGFSKLLSSLGIKHNIRKKIVKCNQKECEVYSITFFVDKANTCFKFNRKTSRLKDKLNDRMLNKSIVDIKEVESRPTKCISVDNERNLYLCGEKNTVTHNSTLVAALLFAELMLGKGKSLICASNNDEQAKIIFTEVENMIRLFDPNYKQGKMRGKYTHINITFIKNKISNNILKRMTDRQKSGLGRNLNFVAVDESNQLATGEMPSQLIKGTSIKKNAKFINITTEGVVHEGYLDQELREARKILKGERKDDSAKSTLCWLYTQDSEQEIWNVTKDNVGDIDHPCVWQKSNPSMYQVKQIDYFFEQLAESRHNPVERAQTLIYDFNIKQNAIQSWLLESEYTYIQDIKQLEEFRGTYCFGSVDLSFSTDLSSAKILLMKPNDNRKYIFGRYFIPESKLHDKDDKEAGAKYIEWAEQGFLEIHEGNSVKLDKIAEWFKMLYQEYDIILYKLGYDLRFAKDFLDTMKSYGYGYGKGEVCEMINQSKYVLSTPMKEVRADLKSELIHGLNEMDKWCLSNTSYELDGEGRIMPKKTTDSKRIDGTLTLIMLYAILSRYRSEYMNAINR